MRMDSTASRGALSSGLGAGGRSVLPTRNSISASHCCCAYLLSASRLGATAATCCGTSCSPAFVLSQHPLNSCLHG